MDNLISSCKINKFIKNYKHIENDLLELNKKSNELLNEQQKIKSINKHNEYINYIISIYENKQIDYSLL